MWREPLPDEVILSDFERLLELGDRGPIADQYNKEIDVAYDLLSFLDEYGERLVELVRLGIDTMRVSLRARRE
jgi:hypothetical protein